MKELERLTVKERRFFYAYLETGKQITAFRKAFPDSKLKKPELAGHKLMHRIKDKYDWERLLEEAGLGYEKICAKLAQLTEAKVAKFNSKGEEVAIIPDNATQIKALELLVDLYGFRKQVIEHTGNVTFTEAVQQAYERRQQLRLVKDEDVSNG